MLTEMEYGDTVSMRSTKMSRFERMPCKTDEELTESEADIEDYEDKKYSSPFKIFTGGQT